MHEDEELPTCAFSWDDTASRVSTSVFRRKQHVR
jgi:hypothetical protein